MGTQAGIVACIGANGDGKTLCLVQELAVPAMELGLPILSNVELPGYKHWEHLRSWRQLVNFRPRRTEAGSGVVLLDDISTLLPSRQSMSVPPELVWTLNTLRKRGAQVGWSDPAWEGADTLLRRVTRRVIICRGFVSDRWQRQPGRAQFPLRGRKATGEDGRAVPAVSGFGWAPKCLFRYQEFDARTYDVGLPTAVREAKRGKGPRPTRRWWYWAPAHMARWQYDTTAELELMDWLAVLGSCMNCGRQVKREYCRCSTADREHAAHLVGAVEDDE